MSVFSMSVGGVSERDALNEGFFYFWGDGVVNGAC